VDGINNFIREVLISRCPPLTDIWEGAEAKDLDRLKYELARRVAAKWAVAHLED
jgi:hypothetical protein